MKEMEIEENEEIKNKKSIYNHIWSHQHHKCDQHCDNGKTSCDITYN